MGHDFRAGNVCRLSFKWPQDAGKERADGSKERHAIVVATTARGFFAAPITSVPPERGQEKYALKLSTMTKRQLGLDTERTSWVKTNLANFVEPPNPSIRKWQPRRGAETTFVLGDVPRGLLSEIATAQEAAGKAGAMRALSIPRHDAERERDRLRMATTTRAKDRKQTVPATIDGDDARRYAPGDPRRRDGMTRRVRDRAEARSRATAAKQARSTRRHGHEIE